MPTSLSPEQVRLVLRRAAELEKREGRDPDTSAEAEVAEIAAEVGIAPAAVEHALAEVKAGLVRVEPAETSFLDRLVGPGEISATREVPGTVTEVRSQITRFMQQQLMQLKRNLGARGQIWEAAPDLWSNVKRAFDIGQKVAFDKGTEVTVNVVPRPGVDGEVLVKITARLVDKRRSRGWQIAGGTGVGVAMAAAGIAAFTTVGPEIASIVAGAGTAAGSLAAVRSGHKRDLLQAEGAILRFLDRLEHGEPEPPPQGFQKPPWLRWTL